MTNQIKQFTKSKDDYYKLKLGQNYVSTQKHLVQRIYYNSVRKQVKKDMRKDD